MKKTDNRIGKMSGLNCPAGATSYQDSELRAPYTGPSVMAQTMPTYEDTTNRVTDGSHFLTTAFLSGHINYLKGKGIIPAQPDIKALNDKSEDEAIAAYKAKMEELKTIVKNEYCYYYSRYRYAITQAINAIATAQSQTVANTSVDRFTSLAATLNTRLQDLSQITNAITENQYSDIKNMQTSINDANTQINSYMTQLQEHAKILRKEVPAVELRKRMVQYTKEKANANKNLLSLYFFLDVVALGVLFYVYNAQ